MSIIGSHSRHAKSRITRNARYFPRNRLEIGGPPVAPIKLSNPPFSNPPRRTRSIHALAGTRYRSYARISWIFRHLVTLHAGRTPASSLTHGRDRRLVRSVELELLSFFSLSFFSSGDPSPLPLPLPPASSHPRSIFYTGHFGAGQEALTILFFFPPISPVERISQDSVIPASGFTFPSRTARRCSISGREEPVGFDKWLAMTPGVIVATVNGQTSEHLETTAVMKSC